MIAGEHFAGALQRSAAAEVLRACQCFMLNRFTCLVLTIDEHTALSLYLLTISSLESAEGVKEWNLQSSEYDVLLQDGRDQPAARPHRGPGPAQVCEQRDREVPAARQPQAVHVSAHPPALTSFYACKLAECI